jgi:hypothetical protein
MKQRIYSTYVSRGLHSNDVLNAAFGYLIKNQKELVSVFKGSTKICFITDRNAEVPKFRIPLWVGKDAQNNPHKDTNYLIVDMRSQSNSEQQLTRTFAALTAGWEDEAINETYQTFTPLPLRTFAMWISRNLSVRFNLSLEEQNSIAIYSALYYLCLGSSVGELFNTRNEAKTIDRIAKATNLPATKVQELCAATDSDLFGDDDEPTSIYVLIALLQSISPQTRDVVTLPSLLAVTNRVWVGDNGTTLCTAALEYPPIFLALVYCAVKDSSYNQTTLAKLLKEFLLLGSQREQAATYIKVVEGSMKQYLTK